MHDHLHTPEVLAARKAAWRLKAENRHKLTVFTVRLSGLTFGWELRHLGSIIHHRSTEAYPSAELARQAGEAALTALTDAAT